MSEACNEPCPTDAIIFCQKAVHPFGAHYNRTYDKVWEGTAMPVRTKSGDSRVKKIIGSIHEPGKVGPPVSGPPPQAIENWATAQEAWLVQAQIALRQVCRTHKRFTTDDVWPLVDNPRERRAMVMVVQHGLRHGWMAEVSAQREHGVWTTRDGVTFPLNKLVPIYHSLII
jgi:hypothetical protein